MYRVILTEQAREDADAIYEWMREHRSPEFAERWYQGLFQQIDTLTRLPRRCPVASESDKFPAEIRELLHGRRKSGTYRILISGRCRDRHDPLRAARGARRIGTVTGVGDHTFKLR